MCTCMIECVYVCVCVRWVVGHLQLQAVYVCPSGKVLFSLSSRGPQAVCGGYLFTLSQGTLFYCQCKHIPVLWKSQTHRKILHIHSWTVAPFLKSICGCINLYCMYSSMYTYIHLKAVSLSCLFYLRFAEVKHAQRCTLKAEIEL